MRAAIRGFSRGTGSGKRVGLVFEALYFGASGHDATGIARACISEHFQFSTRRIVHAHHSGE